MQLEQILSDPFSRWNIQVTWQLLLFEPSVAVRRRKKKSYVYHSHFGTKICITVSHPLLLFKLSKRNMVTFERFLSETARLGKKTGATLSAKI